METEAKENLKQKTTFNGEYVRTLRKLVGFAFHPKKFKLLLNEKEKILHVQIDEPDQTDQENADLLNEYFGGKYRWKIKSV
jgi:hypothetical protein